MHYTLDFISPKMRKLLSPGISKSHFSEKKLCVSCYKNAFVVPFFDWGVSIGGLADNNKKVIIDLPQSEFAEGDSPFMEEEQIQSTETVIFLGVMIATFGHTFTDNIRKLWFLQTDKYKKLIEKGARVVYVTENNQPLPPYSKEILSYVGCNIDSFVHISKLTQFKEIFVPDNSFFEENTGRCYTKEFISTISQIKSNIFHLNYNFEVPNKIYLSRKEFSKQISWHKEYGEETIEKEMNKNGFVSIQPEKYTFAEQVYIVQHCKELATTEGSIAHITIFCKPHSKVVLFCKSRYMNIHQVAINQFADLDVTYVEAHHSMRVNKKEPWLGPFYLCVTKYFERFLGYKVPHIPFFLRLSFWKYMRIIRRLLKKIFKL